MTKKKPEAKEAHPHQHIFNELCKQFDKVCPYGLQNLLERVKQPFPRDERYYNMLWDKITFLGNKFGCVTANMSDEDILKATCSYFVMDEDSAIKLGGKTLEMMGGIAFLEFLREMVREFVKDSGFAPLDGWAYAFHHLLLNAVLPLQDGDLGDVDFSKSSKEIVKEGRYFVIKG